MFSEIFSSRQSSPVQTYSIILCSIGVTVATIIFTNLEHVFGSFDDDTIFINRLSLVFQHGFDRISSIIHLIVDVILIFIFGSFIEKIVGQYHFFLLNLLSFAVYIILHHLLRMTGHGGSGLIWAYIPVIFYILSEGRILKPRSVFDEFYRFLRNILFGVILLFPFLITFVPIYFNSETPIIKAFMLGNLFHLSGLVSGALFLYLFKEKIFVRLKQFARKKKFEQPSGKRQIYFLFYPALVIAGFILMRL